MHYAQDKIKGYTEITFEQFKKYVLKEEQMEIIGYKLKEDCFIEFENHLSGKTKEEKSDEITIEII